MDFGEKVIPFIEISESKKIRKTYCIPIFKIDPLTAEPCLLVISLSSLLQVQESREEESSVQYGSL